MEAKKKKEEMGWGGGGWVGWFGNATSANLKSFPMVSSVACCRE